MQKKREKGSIAMDRETALQQLQDMRREILAIYTETDNCRKIQRRVEALQKEKEQPAPPAAVPLKPENTADKLQKTLEQQNRQRHASNTKPALLIKLVNAALQVILCVLLVLDLFGQKGIIIQEAMLAQITQFGSSNAAMLFAAQLILSLLVVLAPLCWSFFTRRRVLFGILFGLVAIFYFYIMGTMVKAWLYVILFAVSVGLLLAAFAVLRSVRSHMVSSPTLTAAQKQQVQAASQADERAKAENAKARAAARQKSEAEHQRRLPEIDKELQANAQEFSAGRKRIDEHMERLAAMDCLCEEDKNLQTVELLIRFINTRRADSIKEALQEYDKLMANRQLLEIEKQKLQAELQRTASEHADRMQQLEAQKRHQSELEYLARDSARSRAQIVDQLNSIGNIIYYDLRF